MTIDPVRPEIRALRAYDLRPDAALPLKAKLDFNESPYDVPPEVKARVLERLAARRWALYPEFGARRLREAIGASIGRKADEVVVGNGSGEVLLAAASVFAGSGGTLVLAPPTFTLYGQIAVIAGASVVSVPRMGDDFDPDEGAFLAAARAPRAVPLLCSPNNPTGGVLPPGLLARLAAPCSVVLLDQAYVDFASPEDDAIPLLDSIPNLVIFRTLSKAFCAAGFRIGYAVARPELAAELRKAVLPFSVDQAAEELALALLEDPSPARRTVATVLVERERLATSLGKLGCAVASSRANFLFFSPPADAATVRKRLLERGVLVRDMTSSAPNRLRLTVGTPSENDLFLTELKESL